MVELLWAIKKEIIMDIAEIIYQAYTKDNLNKDSKENFAEEEKSFIDKLSVADARIYYNIIEQIANRNSYNQLELINYVIDFYSKLFIRKEVAPQDNFKR